MTRGHQPDDGPDDDGPEDDDRSGERPTGHPPHARGEPLTDAERAEIIELCRNGLGRNEIARRTGRAAGTVTAVVGSAGLGFTRSATAAAAEAHRVDCLRRRGVLVAGLLSDVDMARAWLAGAEDTRALAEAARAVQALTTAYGRIADVDRRRQYATDAEARQAEMDAIARTFPEGL